MKLLHDYGTDRFSNYTNHCHNDSSICASFWMELHDHKYDTNKTWSLVPLVVHHEDVRIVVYDKCFKTIKPIVGESITFNHKLLHGLLPAHVAKFLEGKKRKTREYLAWETDYVQRIRDKRSSYPVMEWKFI